MLLSTFPILGQTNALATTGMNIVNASAAVTHGPWLGGLYVTNLADKRVVLSPGTLTPSINNLGTEDVINQPRMISLRVRYSF
jgi:outer membrane receptor protein involved in Fe transport